MFGIFGASKRYFSLIFVDIQLLLLLQLILWLLVHFVNGTEQVYPSDFVPLKSAIRLRLNEPIFRQLSRITDYLYNSQITRASIPSQQQCFPEGCMQLYNFQITAHRPPSIVVVIPTPPNLIAISIRDFDIYITGSLSGQLQPLQPLPIAVPAAGSISASAVHLGVAAILDLQKTSQNIPYLRVISCTLNEGNVGARVENMGLINEIVNSKYQNEIVAKTREVMQTNMCTNLQEIITKEFNRRLARVPAEITGKELFDLFIQKFDVDGVDRMRRDVHVPRSYRATNTDARFTNPYINYGGPRMHQAPTFQQQVSNNASLKMSQFFNVKRLANLIVHTDVLDTSATFEKFFVGINGDVTVVDEKFTTGFYSRPDTLKFVIPSNGRALELLISEFTLNTMLLKAHTIDAVVFRIGSDSPSFGKLLRTSCSIDDVCLSDIVSEPGEKYPNTQLEIILRSTEPPTVQLSRGVATLHFEGRALFYIEGSTKKIGVIPFETTALFKVTTVDGRVVGTFSVPKLVFKKELDFFGLSNESLDGLRTATKGALNNMINTKLKNGIKLTTRPTSRFTDPTVLIMNDAILIQTDINIENEFYQTT